MSNAIQFDATANATVKQIYMIGSHFAKLTGSNPQEVWGLTKRFPAAMMKWNAEHSNTPITMGDINTWKSGNKVPAKFVKMVTAKKPTSPKTSKKSPKPEAVAKPKASPKPSEMPVGDFKDHFEKITGRVFRLENDMATMNAKLDIIMAFVQEDPEA